MNYKFLKSEIDFFTSKALENYSQFYKDKKHFETYAKSITDNVTRNKLMYFRNSLETIDLINKQTWYDFSWFLCNNITDNLEMEIKKYLLDTIDARRKQLENKRDKYNKNFLARDIEKKQKEYFEISDLITELKTYFNNIQKKYSENLTGK